MKSQFLLALCQPGAEAALKAEALAAGAKSSFQRKGFVTFNVGAQVGGIPVGQGTLAFSAGRGGDAAPR